MASSVAVKRLLSGSVDGCPILIAAITSPGTLIHTAVAGQVAGTYDEIHLYATNNSTADVNLTIEFGGTTIGFQKQMLIPAKKGEYFVIPGFILQNAKVVKAFAGTTNVISITGWVNSIVDGA